jgi:hypothetical protein
VSRAASCLCIRESGCDWVEIRTRERGYVIAPVPRTRAYAYTPRASFLPIHEDFSRCNTAQAYSAPAHLQDLSPSGVRTRLLLFLPHVHPCSWWLCRVTSADKSCFRGYLTLELRHQARSCQRATPIRALIAPSRPRQRSIHRNILTSPPRPCMSGSLRSLRRAKKFAGKGVS